MNRVMRIVLVVMLASVLVPALVLAGCSTGSIPTPAPAPAPTPTPVPVPVPVPAPSPSPTPPTTSAPSPAPALTPSFVPVPVADFQLQNLDGQTVSLSGLRGNPVVLNFWASWCGPCRAEMPLIQEVFEDKEWSDKGLTILAINIGEDRSTAERFMEDNGLSFPVLLDTSESVAREYNIRYIPTTFFIDKDGIARDIKIGAFLNKAEIERGLSSIIQ